MESNKLAHLAADRIPTVVSRAFQILSDPDKKSKFDKFGGDPDNRFGASSSASAGASPFSGFARSQGGGMGGQPNYGEEISPEELFRQFFGGGGFGGGPFGTDPTPSDEQLEQKYEDLSPDQLEQMIALMDREIASLKKRIPQSYKKRKTKKKKS